MKKTKTIPTLTPREREVLALLADGYDNEETGKILTLSRRTIEVMLCAT